MSNTIGPRAANIPGMSGHNTDTTPPKQPTVKGGSVGEVPVYECGNERKERRLYILFDGDTLEPNAKLQLFNLSKDPQGHYPYTLEGEGCYYNLIAKNGNKVDVPDPGDWLAVRQVDAGGNASESFKFNLDSKATPHPGKHLQYRILNDERPPTFVPGRMRWENGRLQGSEGSVEPLATVQVENGRTKEIFDAKADMNGKFSLQFTAKAGDPLTLHVVDINGNRAWAEPVSYQPPSSANC